jgi:prepilin-type N-terminal cleavage/methylation domain-containing protein
MVLRPPAEPGNVRTVRTVRADRADLGNRGVTLIELVVSMALSVLVAAMALAFFKDAGNAARLSRGRREAGFQAQALFSSLSENLLAGSGVLRVGEGRLVLLNGRDLRVEYKKEDSTLSVNGKALGLRVGEFLIEPMGPSRPDRNAMGGLGEQPWDLDSLDQDRDGLIGFSELDRDRNGELDEEECRFVALFRVTLTIVDQNLPMTQVGIVHPRNHFPALTGKDLETSVKSEDFPGF